MAGEISWPPNAQTVRIALRPAMPFVTTGETLNVRLAARIVEPSTLRI
jgi:hypothetical protein